MRGPLEVKKGREVGGEKKKRSSAQRLLRDKMSPFHCYQCFSLNTDNLCRRGDFISEMAVAECCRRKTTIKYVCSGAFIFSW